ncbi:unnamed protein product, partial [Discosporangium mesarthrocarpum]
MDSPSPSARLRRRSWGARLIGGGGHEISEDALEKENEALRQQVKTLKQILGLVTSEYGCSTTPSPIPPPTCAPSPAEVSHLDGPPWTGSTLHNRQESDTIKYFKGVDGTPFVEKCVMKANGGAVGADRQPVGQAREGIEETSVPDDRRQMDRGNEATSLRDDSPLGEAAGVRAVPSTPANSSIKDDGNAVSASSGTGEPELCRNILNSDCCLDKLYLVLEHSKGEAARWKRQHVSACEELAASEERLMKMERELESTRASLEAAREEASRLMLKEEESRTIARYVQEQEGVLRLKEVELAEREHGVAGRELKLEGLLCKNRELEEELRTSWETCTRLRVEADESRLLADKLGEDLRLAREPSPEGRGSGSNESAVALRRSTEMIKQLKAELSRVTRKASERMREGTISSSNCPVARDSGRGYSTCEQDMRSRLLPDG